MIKNFTLLTVMTLITVSISACKLDGVDPEDLKGTDTVKPTTPGKTDPVDAEYYITYTVNGVAVSATEISAVRGTGSPRTLTITGTAKNGAGPKIKFFVEEPSISPFQGGMTFGNSSYTYPTQYVDFTNSSNIVYSSSKSTESMSFGFLGVSFTNGGEAFGGFNGDIKITAGKVEILDGKFKVKFSN